MDSKRIDRYRKKLVYLKRYHGWLTEWMEKTPLDMIEENCDYQALMGIYHTAQNAVEAIIDIMAMINKDLSHIVQNNTNNLDFLIQEGIVSIKIRRGIIDIVGLRNRLAHDYNGIVDTIAWESIELNLDYFQIFHRGIEEWLNQQTR